MREKKTRWKNHSKRNATKCAMLMYLCVFNGNTNKNHNQNWVTIIKKKHKNKCARTLWSRHNSAYNIEILLLFIHFVYFSKIWTKLVIYTKIHWIHLHYCNRLFTSSQCGATYVRRTSTRLTNRTDKASTEEVWWCEKKVFQNIVSRSIIK